MLGSGFRFYLGYNGGSNVATSITTLPIDPTKILRLETLIKTDGTNVDATAGVKGINELTWLFADELKDVTEAGSPNTINTTTRSVARTNTQSNEITTVSRDLTAQFVYERHASFRTPVPQYSVLDLLEYLEVSKDSIAIIDLDNAMSTDGARSGCANYTVSLSQPREVEGQVVYDVTFALKNLYQRVEFEGGGTGGFRALIDP